MIIIKDKDLILKLRSLGAGVEEDEFIKLSDLEAKFFVEIGVLPKDTKIDESGQLFSYKYEVLKYLRNRGYIVRPSLEDDRFMRLYKKGIRPGEDRTQYILKVLKKGEKISEEEIREWLDFAGKMRKELIVVYPGPTFVKLSRVNFE